MHKFFKNVRCLKCICFLLVCIFVINVTAGCAEDNGVPSGLENAGYENRVVGTGNNIQGYTIYGESTFDPMTQELFYGYLLSGRNFTLLVLPGTEDGVPKHPKNKLFASAQAGIYEFDASTASFKDAENKALIYYTTDLQLRKWFKNAENKDNFLNHARQFFSAEEDLESPDRFRCVDLVNMGGGLNATDFCDFMIKGSTNNSNQQKLNDMFTDDITGGMVLLFGEGSIEGYFTYNDIIQNDNLLLANSLDNCTYTFVNEGFNFSKLLSSSQQVMKNAVLGILYSEYEAVNDSVRMETIKDQLDRLINGEFDEALNEFKQAVIAAYAEAYLANPKGCERLQRTYEMIERALIEDSKGLGANISALTNIYRTKKDSETDESLKNEYTLLYNMCLMFDDFNETAREEAFNIKFSVSLWSRFHSIKNVSKVDSDILIGRTYEDSININDIGVAQNLKNGSSSNNNGNYLMLITADGYVIDRGTPQDQIDMGMSDDLLGTSLLSELITMDACANTTLALDIFNLLVNLKIVAGTVGVVSGLVVLATAATVSTIIAKVAAGTAAAPVPGARIAALVLLVVAGLIMLGAGIYTLWEAYQDKKRIEAIGGSKVNYCENYTATLKLILQDLSLSLPVYHYNIEKETDDIENDDLSLMYCTKGSYDYTKSKCVDDDGNPLNNKPFQVTLAYYANKDEVQKLNLEGAPMLIYYRNNEIVDYIYGAATPEFIIEMLRLWGTLAIREIAYTLKVNGGNISLHHTNNTNTNTLTIQEAKYCISDQYKLNAYTAGSGDFCHNNSSVNIDKKWDGNSEKSFLDLSISSMSTGLQSAIEEKYRAIHVEETSYIYNEFKNNNIIMETEETNYSFEEGVLLPIVGSGGNYYYNLEDSTLYRKVGLFEYKKFARLKEGVSIDSLLGTFINDINLEDFLNYLAGEKTFEEVSTTYSLYLNVTVKEDQHAYNADGKYLYYRSETLFGWFDGYVWKDKDKGDNKSNFRPVGVEEAKSAGQNPKNGEAAYVTSKEIGYVIVKLDSQGNKTIELKLIGE